MEERYSINTGEITTISVVDYVIFGITLLISAGIGLFYAIKDRHKSDSKTYLLGERSMYVVPVAMSLLVTFMSALTLLGTPAEMYNFTTMFWWICLSFALALLATALIFVPFFFKLGITSVFEYLEMRFSKPVRVYASLMFIFQAIVYIAFILYAPSLALSAVTGFHLWGSVLAVGLVVTLYTTLGGMKAVLWTDTFQALVMGIGLLAVLIQGCIQIGGFGRAWEIAANRSRIEFFDFNVDPSVRHSWWTVVVGGTFFWIALYGVNQAQVQRAMSCPTIKKAKIALLINIPGLFFITSMCCMIGIVMFAFYSDCHPLRFKNLIGRADQLVPLYVMDILGHLPGLPGIFLSCVFSGSLSSVSSSLSALSAVVPHDFIKPYCCKNISDKSMTIISKIVVLICGGIGIALAFVVSRLGGVLQAAYSVFGVITGPTLGLFVLGMFFPWANAWGALSGGLVSTAFVAWIAFGAFANGVSTAVPSPVSTSGCNWTVTEPVITTTPIPFTGSTTMMTTTSGSSDPFLPMYSVSYLYYTPIGTVVVVIIGMLVSCCTGLKKPSSMDPRLLCPIFDILFPCLPESILRPLRCGVNHSEKYDADVVMVNKNGIISTDPYREKSYTVENNDSKNDYPMHQNGVKSPYSYSTHL